jgi:hypothetical protein
LPLQWSSSSPALWLRGRNCPAVAEEAATVVAAVAAPLHPRAVTAVAEEAAVVPLHSQMAVTVVVAAEAVVPLRHSPAVVAVMAEAVTAAVLPLWHLPAVGVAEELPHRRSPMGVAVATVAVAAEVAAVMAEEAVLPLWRLRTAVATVLPSMVAAEAAL